MGNCLVQEKAKKNPMALQKEGQMGNYLALQKEDQMGNYLALQKAVMILTGRTFLWISSEL
jgi:hypothetical protein